MSMVQALLSSQAIGAKTQFKVESHPSTVQALLSLQIGVNWHPKSESQASVVQALLSSQIIGVN
jgi:hypothetical protein